MLGLVLHYAVNKSASDYLHEKVWEPIGAEADAKWLIDAEGYEVAHHGFNAVLRDYARLGRLLAHDGGWEGKQIVPVQWMIDATTTRPSDAYLAPGRTSPRSLGYGYLLWLLPGTRRQFAAIGLLDSVICVDPASKLVMVQTALERQCRGLAAVVGRGQDVRAGVMAGYGHSAFSLNVARNGWPG